MRSAAAPFKGPFYYYLAELRKGRSQKYIKRIPKAGGGYRYVYKEHHQGGVGAQEHMKAGAAFKLSFQGQEGHFHIIKAEGDRLIVKHDELHGPDHKGVELTKAELSALLMAEHRPALEADAKKKRARVDKMKRETPRHIGLKRAERLAQEAEARAGVEPKTPAQDTERPDNFETMPEDTAPDEIKRDLEPQTSAELARIFEAELKRAGFKGVKTWIKNEGTPREIARIYVQGEQRGRRGQGYIDLPMSADALPSSASLFAGDSNHPMIDPRNLPRLTPPQIEALIQAQARLSQRLKGKSRIIADPTDNRLIKLMLDYTQRATATPQELTNLIKQTADMKQISRDSLNRNQTLEHISAGLSRELVSRPAPAPTPTPAPDNFETMPESSAPEDTAAKASEAAQLLMERINELRNQQSASISEDEALELDEQILDAQLSLRKLERIERKARRAAAKEQAPQAQPVEPPKAEPVKVEPSEAPAGTKTINVTLTNANQINAFKVVSGAKNIKAQNIQGQEYELTASPQDFENALSDLENVIAWEQSGRGGRRTPNAARVKQYRTLRNKLARAVKNAPLIQEEEAPAPKKQTPRAQLLEAAQINLEDYLAETAPQTAELPPKGQRTAEDARQFFGEPRKYEQKTGGAKTRKLVRYERDGFAVQGPASGRGKGRFSVTLNYTQSQLSEARAFTEPSSQVLGIFDTLDEALTAAINQHETRQEQTKRLATSAQAQRAEQKRRMLGEQTPRERLTETAREITAPAPEPVQAKNALPYEQTHEPLIIDLKRTAARNAAYDIIALIDERAGATINDPRSLTALTAKLTAKKIADKGSAFSYWGFRQREAGESAKSNPHAAAFERHLSKKPAHMARHVNASDIAEFTRAHLGIERVNDLKGKENQVKEIAARFARDSFTEALRIGEEARDEAFSRITDKGSEYFEAAPNYLKKLIAGLESNAEQMSTNPQASREIQSIIPLAKRALTHYQKRAKEIQSQPFRKTEFLEGLKTSTNSRHLIQGEPRGTAVKKRTEALVYEAINRELNKLIEQHKKTEATPKPTPINHSLIEALEQGPLKQLKKPFRQEEADA